MALDAVVDERERNKQEAQPPTEEGRAGESVHVTGAQASPLRVGSDGGEEATNADQGALLRAVIETAADGIITIDESGEMQSFNRAAERIFGYASSEVVGQNVNVLMLEYDAGRHDAYISRYLTTGTPHVIGSGREVECLRRDGTTFPARLEVRELEVSGARRFCGFVRDLTDSKRVEEQLAHAQKMEAIGTLASGIAHDFNNLLMGIAGCAAMALRSVGAGHPAHHLVMEIQESAKRGTAVTRQLLNFGHKRRFAPRPMDLWRVTEEILPACARLVGEQLRVTMCGDSANTGILADPGQVEQILVNLLTNARDAMPEGGKVCVEIRALPDSMCEWVVLSVADTGVGMSDDVRKRAFEPFFTTKDVGQGTGLGLSSVYKIAETLGGHTELSSVLGEGTQVQVFFPLATLSVAAEDAPLQVAAIAPWRGARVLVVEDERLVRLTVVHYLKELGLKVVAAEDAAAGLDIARREEHLDLIVTDIMMPGIGGKELAQSVRALHPQIREIYMSAFPPDDLIERDRIAEGDVVLSKPFSAEMLSRRLAEVYCSADATRSSSLV